MEGASLDSSPDLPQTSCRVTVMGKESWQDGREISNEQKDSVVYGWTGSMAYYLIVQNIALKS